MKHLKIEKKIEKCGDCLCCDFDEFYGNHCFFDLDNVRFIGDPSKIADFCPLPDSKEDEKKLYFEGILEKLIQTTDHFKEEIAPVTKERVVALVKGLLKSIPDIKQEDEHKNK
jgi:hypothetical protein